MVSGQGTSAAADGTAQPVPVLPQYSTEQYREIASFADALRLAQASFGDLVTADDLGDGFQLVKDEAKGTLVGIPMVCLYAQLRTGDLGGYVVARCVTEDGRKVVIVDGGTGMFDQMNTYMTSHGGRWPNVWKKGLRRSDYKIEVTDKNGEVKTDASGKPLLTDATTFYIDTSA